MKKQINPSLISLTIVFIVINVSTLWASEISTVFKNINPSVVIIKTGQYDQVASGNGKQNLSYFGLGSGVVISDDGKILTAAHVVQTADRIIVEFLGGEEIPAKVEASAPFADISLLKLDRLPQNIKLSPIGDSDQIEVGEQIFVVGAPYGIKHTLTVGYISGMHSSKDIVGSMTPMEIIQTDAAINVGNSGGPIFNLQGEVIGIVSYILSQSGGFEGIGFAISSNLCKRLLIDQKAFWTGIDGYLLTGEMATLFNLPAPAGLLVEKVAAGSPYAFLGLKGGYLDITIEDEQLIGGGDIILEVGGMKVPDNAEEFSRFTYSISALKKGDLLTAKVLRNGKIETLSVKL